jgi:hypothetical protein
LQVDDPYGPVIICAVCVTALCMIFAIGVVDFVEQLSVLG